MKTTDTHVYFWNGIYSNWYPCKIYDEFSKLNFENTEQAFMWYKANLFKDDEVKKQIELTGNPKLVKQLGRQIKNYDDVIWNEARFGWMLAVNLMKFSQHQYLRQALIETGTRTMVEASPLDKVWGVGLDENNPLILDERNWQGQNLLGKVLMRVRESIQK